uniref:CARD domain-containing protein n=1 Tax=Sphaeramia orbicularis TaxID=375764 RepID=A0A672Z5D0_9TELE
MEQKKKSYEKWTYDEAHLTDQSKFVERVSISVVFELLEHLLHHGILNTEEWASFRKEFPRADMARLLFDLVMKKGCAETMMDHLKEIDPFLYESLGLP